MKTSAELTQKTSTNDVLRFAHPFYTNEHINQRSTIEGVGKRMTDYIKTKLEDIPVPQREPTIKLAEVIGDMGVASVQKVGTLRFHCTGDTGIETGNTTQMVADVMSQDYDPDKATSPAFLFHLGDVDYYNNTDIGYHAQFYDQYRTYPGKIIAIPGNHDGELYKYNGVSTGQTVTLEEFQKNFCQSTTGVPSAAGTIYREMVSQPGVYWYLETPFADIIGLYSNVAENPGYISGPAIGNSQKDWLTKTLIAIKAARTPGLQRKSLLIATHHPPFSTGFHSSSLEMLDDIDESCVQAGILPDAFLSAHAHNLQSYTRYVSFNGETVKIPYFICGGGGRPVQHVGEANGARVNDSTKLLSYHTFDKSATSYGYMDIEASATQLSINVYQIAEPGVKSLFASVTLDIK